MAESDITPEILELILRTSRIKGCNHVYSLAPRGHRVGVYFQQRRATLLAAAIRTRLGHDRLKEARIGIVGGGVSGLTFLVAMKNAGVQKAFLYEAADAIITTGAKASHRLVHPNYNRWPLLGSMDMFTSLPILNWYASSADKVMLQLKRQIDSDYSDLIVNRVLLGHRVKRVTQRPARFSSPVRLTFEKQPPEEFDIVVIAAGFGDEHSAAWGFEDYWTKSGEDFDDGTHKRPSLIYGIGDGALIDCVRCCAKKPDEAWHIPLGTIARLRPEAAIIIRKDQAADLPIRSPNFSEVERKIQAHEESLRSIAWAMSRDKTKIIDAYAEAEQQFYFECVDEFDATLVWFLQRELKPVAANPLLRPTLIGSMRYAFEPTSAPINKLLLAFLLRTERIVYSQRSAATQISELDARRKEPATVRRDRVVICRYGADKNFPTKRKTKKVSATRSTAANAVEVAFGPRGYLFSETDVEARLVDALSGITGGEFVFFDEMPDSKTQARWGVYTEGARRATREKNLKILDMFAREHLKASEVVFNAKSERWIIITALTDGEITDQLSKIGGLDGDFFGAPIVVSDQLPVEPVGGTAF